MNELSAAYPAFPVLVVDDDPYALQVCELHLKSRGISHVRTCLSGTEGLTILQTHVVSSVVLDLHMPDMSGEEVLLAICRQFPNVPVIISTAVDDVDTAVRCMKTGAFDYVVKPVNPERLASTIKRAIEFQELRRENALLKERVLQNQVKQPEAFAEIITNSPQMHAIFKYIESIAPTSQPVLITGETGVGKERVADALHRLSGRKGGIVAVNIAGLDETTFSDTLFGHKRGAFTGAERARDGLIEKASNGTLFLDEIGDLSPSSQVKLLRLLQEHEYYPLGSDAPHLTNARIVVATNRNLLNLQEKGAFRADLYYRLLQHHIHVPPLRERLEDLPLLLNYFLQIAADELQKVRPTPPPELLTLLSVYDFPGNIRELQAMIFDAVSRHEGGVLSLCSFKKLILPESYGTAARERQNDGTLETLYASLNRLPSLKESEDVLIQEALKRTSGNRTLTATLLGITRQTLHRWLHGQKQAEA